MKKRKPIKTKSDWEKDRVVKTFCAKGFYVHREKERIFPEETFLSFPYIKYRISVEGGEAYLLLVKFDNPSEAITLAANISNQFRKSGDQYVSSGVNGQILSLIISSTDKETENIRLFDILREM